MAPSASDTAGRPAPTDTTEGSMMPGVLVFDAATADVWKYRSPASDPSQPPMVRLAWWMPPAEPECYLIRLPIGAEIAAGAQGSHGISTQDCERGGSDLGDVMHVFIQDCERANEVWCFSKEFQRNAVESSALRSGVHLEWPTSPQCLMWGSTPIVKKFGRSPAGAYNYPKLTEAYRYFSGNDMEKPADRPPIERGVYVVRCLMEIHDGIVAARQNAVGDGSRSGR